MTMIAVTYGYARVSKADDESKNLDTQLMLLAEHGIRPDLVYSDVASGRNLQRPGWQEWRQCSRPFGFTKWGYRLAHPLAHLSGETFRDSQASSRVLAPVADTDPQGLMTLAHSRPKPVCRRSRDARR